MTVFKIIALILEFFVFYYVVVDLVLTARNARYQKLWRLKKSTLIRIDPAITRAEMCEKYVEFCIMNNCKVDF